MKRLMAALAAGLVFIATAAYADCYTSCYTDSAGVEHCKTSCNDGSGWID